jgi:hypothetical protein
MSKPKKTEIDLSKPYEENDIKLRGTVIFCAVTFSMIVLSFVIIFYMNKWVLGGIADYEAKRANPLALSKQEQLPPEPRLQSAPGFGVGEGDNRVNLELKQPNAEYLEVAKRWHKLETEGSKDPHTGAVSTLSVAEAKAKFLEQGAKQRLPEEAVKSLEAANAIFSGASSGRSTVGR